MAIMQGDSYPIRFSLTDEAGEPITADLIDRIEFTIGYLTKYFPEDITADGDAFLLPLTQSETIKLREEIAPAQVRIKTTSGEVIGQEIQNFKIINSLTKVIL